MALLHVQKFDGEDGGGTMQLIESKNERGMVALPGPPLGRGMKIFEILGNGALDDAQSIQVGVAGAKFAGDGRTVEDHSFQVFAGRFFEAFYVLVELRFHYWTILRLKVTPLSRRIQVATNF